jgi:ketosteroid isomerase-like protein
MEVVLAVFRAIERRDAQRFTSLVHPEFEIRWPPSLPYGGGFRGLDARAGLGRRTWAETWNPLQPTAAERQMDPRVVAASGQEVVVLWRQRGRSPIGGRFDGPVLGLYRVRDGKLACAQMVYFDTAAVAGFLADAERDRASR